MADTGVGTTVSFATAIFNYLIRAVRQSAKEVEDIDDTDLSIDSPDEMTYIPGDNPEPGTVEIDFIWDPTEDMNDADITVIDTITVTLPKENAASAAAATYVGTGYVKSVKPPDLARNQLNMGTLVFKFDGKTGPTYTAEA